MIGTVKRINRDRGFAFIVRPGDPDVFLHVSGMVDRGQFETLQDGQQVEFEPVDSEKGIRAEQVRVLDAV